MWTILVCVIGCGKKVSENKTKNPNPVEDNTGNISTEVSRLLDKQTVNCSNETICPEAIAKVVVVEKDKLRTCTGFMVTQDIIATSSSCLTTQLRVSQDRCGGEFFAYFPKIGTRVAQKIGCKEVLMASEVSEEDPILWLNDIAYIRLQTSPNVRPLKLSRNGLDDSTSFNVWKVDMVNDEEGVIVNERCDVVLKNYINPLAEDKFSPNVVMAGCNFNRGNRGAPIMADSKEFADTGKTFSGLFSQFIDKNLVASITNTGLLRGTLRPMAHVTNGACLPPLFEIREENDNRPESCFAQLDYQQLDRKRANMINSELLYHSVQEEVQNVFETEKPYLKWKVDVVSRDLSGSQIRVVPNCFLKAADWIAPFYYGRGNIRNRTTYSVNLNDLTMDLFFTPETRVQTQITRSRSKSTYYIQFNPKDVFNNKKSLVTVWKWSNNDINREQIFSGDVDSCR